jgi:hypothetical protein
MADNDLLRHTLATIAYRGGKVVRDAPGTFAEFRASESGWTPAQILAHIGDLFDWALSIAEGRQKWHASSPRNWGEEVGRFHAALGAFDEYLGSGKPLNAPAEKLFQGPIADALTHVGQLAMMRRLAGAPIAAENYFVADIVAGRTGADQPPPNRKLA